MRATGSPILSFPTCLENPFDAVCERGATDAAIWHESFFQRRPRRITSVRVTNSRLVTTGVPRHGDMSSRCASSLTMSEELLVAATSRIRLSSWSGQSVIVMLGAMTSPPEACAISTRIAHVLLGSRRFPAEAVRRIAGEHADDVHEDVLGEIEGELPRVVQDADDVGGEVAGTGGGDGHE